MEGEQKRVFLVLADDEIAGIRPPKGIYFTKFLSAAQEMWISEKMMKQKRNPYVLDLCQYFGHKKLKGYADFFNSSSWTYVNTLDTKS